MNREEAIKIFSGIASLAKINTEPTMSVCNVKNEVFTEIQALLSPQPDPITGLVPCGCGGKARIKHDGSYSSKCIVKNADETVRYENATVVYPGHTHAWVDCDNNKCECSVGYCGGLIFRTDEEARDAWNVAMGYTAPLLPEVVCR